MEKNSIPLHTNSNVPQEKINKLTQGLTGGILMQKPFASNLGQTSRGCTSYGGFVILRSPFKGASSVHTKAQVWPVRMAPLSWRQLSHTLPPLFSCFQHVTPPPHPERLLVVVSVSVSYSLLGLTSPRSDSHLGVYNQY